MFEVTKDNYHQFLTYHGLDVFTAQKVVDMYYDTDSYHQMLSVRLWVDASRMLLRTVYV